MKEKIIPLVILLVIFLHPESKAQNLEISGGAGKNVFFKVQDRPYDFGVDVSGNKSWSLALTASTNDSPKGLISPVIVSLRYDFYKAHLITYSDQSGLGCSGHTDVEISRSVLGLAFYPISFRLASVVDFNLGVEGGMLINGEADGHRAYSCRFGGGSSYMEFTNDSQGFNKGDFLGLSTRIGTEFKLSDKYNLSLRYRFSWGFTDEFRRLESQLRLFRNSIEIGLVRKNLWQPAT